MPPNASTPRNHASPSRTKTSDPGGDGEPSASNRALDTNQIARRRSPSPDLYHQSPHQPPSGNRRHRGSFSAKVSRRRDHSNDGSESSFGDYNSVRLPPTIAPGLSLPHAFSDVSQMQRGINRLADSIRRPARTRHVFGDFAPSSSTFPYDSLSPTPDQTPFASDIRSPRLRNVYSSITSPDPRTLPPQHNATPALPPIHPHVDDVQRLFESKIRRTSRQARMKLKPSPNPWTAEEAESEIRRQAALEPEPFSFTPDGEEVDDYSDGDKSAGWPSSEYVNTPSARKIELSLPESKQQNFMPYTISKDCTAGEEQRFDDLLAEFGRKSVPTLMLRSSFGDFNGRISPLITSEPPGAGKSASSMAYAAAQVGDLIILDLLRNNAQFQKLREMVQQQPEMLEPILQQLGAGNPQVAQLIASNPDQFLQLLGENADDDDDDDDVLLPPGAQAISVPKEERDAIERLCRLGFDRDQAIQAYFACDKNEELAANFLFDQLNDKNDIYML